MKNEQKYLLELLKNFIHGEPSTDKGVFSSKSDSEVTALFNLSQQHQITGIVYYQCKAYCNDSRFKTISFHTMSKSARLKWQSDVITGLLRENNISYFPVKGFEVAQYYRIPSLRTMGDLDLIVPEREKADAIMQGLGYSISTKPEDHDWNYSRDNIEVELHNKLVYSQAINTPGIENFFNAFEAYVKDNSLDKSFHFLYLLLHLRKHFMNAGVGLRQFMDLAVMIENCTDLDWPWIEEKLKDLRLDKFAGNVFALIDRWFDCRSPVLQTALSDEFYETATEKIMTNGVFGAENKENGKNAAINSVKEYKVYSGIRQVLLKLFPTYEDMSKTEQYKFISCRPYMLPIAWIYRFWYCIRHGKIESGKKQIKNSNIKRTDYDRRVAEMSQWGLG